MNRLLFLNAESNVTCEVLINEMAVARLKPRAPAVVLPVHEFLCEGRNELSLIMEPQVEGRPCHVRAPAALAAHARLVLTPFDEACGAGDSHEVAALQWSVAAGQVYTRPAERRQNLQLPVRFPRWGWMAMPRIASFQEWQGRAEDFIYQLGEAFGVGDPSLFLSAARPRFEDLAVAYRRPFEDMRMAFGQRLRQQHAEAPWLMHLLEADELLLKPCAGGRLAECVSKDGQPALRTEPDQTGVVHAWPMRVAFDRDACLIVR